MKKFIAILTFTLVLAYNLSAGWLIKMSEGGNNQNIYFEGKKMAVVDGQTNMILDAAYGKMYMINNSQKIYWEGQVDDFVKMIEESVVQGKKAMVGQMEMMKEQMKNLPPEQQAMMKKMMGMAEEESTPIKVICKKIGTEKIKNIPCDKYEIYENGKLVERLWISDDLPFFDDYKKGKFQESMQEMQSKMEKIAGGITYKANKEYMKLVSSKMPVKSESKPANAFQSGENWEISEYISSKQMNVDKYINVPSGYNKAPLMQVMGQPGMRQPGGMNPQR